MNKNDEINKFINIFNENFSKFHNMSFRKQLEVFYDQIKDNPVPSIDNLIEICRQMVYLAASNPKQKVYAIKTINEEFQKLQNGVETDKEEPIKSKCSCIKPNYGFKSVAVCTDCNGIKDDEYWEKLGL